MPTRRVAPPEANNDLDWINDRLYKECIQSISVTLFAAICVSTPEALCKVPNLELAFTSFTFTDNTISKLWTTNRK